MSSCLTIPEFLLQTGADFSTFGPASQGTISILDTIAEGDTITIGGVVLTAEDGARTPGSNDFDLNGTPLQVAQEIVNAINDPLNSFTPLVIAAIQIPGIPIIQLTSIATGYYSTLPIATSNATSIGLSGTNLSGGELLITSILVSTCSMLGDCWGAKKGQAHLYLSAHMLSVAAGAFGGIVSSKAIDKISIGYAVTAPTDAELGSTKWGIMYLAIRKTVANIGALAGRGGFGLCGC
jgi:hypothetical protein